VAGGLAFAYWNQDVRQFLIDNGRFFYDEYRVDGLRFDLVNEIDNHGGAGFCQDLTGTYRTHRPPNPLIAEYWRDPRRRAVDAPSHRREPLCCIEFTGVSQQLRSLSWPCAGLRRLRP
jgi:hypothetical protein